MITPLVAIAWPGAGRSSVSPTVVHSVSAIVTVLFMVLVFRLSRRLSQEDLRRRAAKLLPFRRRDGRSRPTAMLVAMLVGSPLARLLLSSVAAVALAPAVAGATPSTTYWAPSTASCQAWRIPHVTYDTYFGKGPAAGSAGAPNYPIDTGLTMGVSPSAKLQAEVGFDLLLPSQDPLFLNAKLCTPESSLFKGSPGLSAGIYNVGFKEGVTDYNVLHLMAQKSIPGGGYVAAGLYHGLGNEALFTNSEGKVVRTGAIAGFFSPDIKVGVKGLKKLNITADVQTGKNVLGAGGPGLYIYFTDTISLLTGPVFFFDKALQPGGRRMLWTFQLDVDVPLGRK
jgi:hypothetical protein